MLGLGNGKGDVMDSSIGVKAVATALVRRTDGWYVVPVSFSKADEGRPGFVKGTALLAALVDAAHLAFGFAEHYDPAVMNGQCHSPVPLDGRYEIWIDIIDRNAYRASAELHHQDGAIQLAFMSCFFTK